MPTSTVGATVDTTTKTIADAYIRNAGLTPNRVIRELWEHIASTGQIPHYDTTTEDPTKKRRKDAFDQMQRIIDAMPTGTPLATMTDDDIRRELENRDA